MADKCEQCGAELEPGEAFCSECGARLDQSLSYAEQPEPVPVDPGGTDTGPLVRNDISSGRTSVVPLPSPAFDPTPSEIKRASANAKAEFYSDCGHFSVEWNQGASVFLTGAMSSFQFRVTPLSPEAGEAGDFCFYLRFPGNDEFRKFDPRFHRLRSSRTANFNYRPESSSMGVSQNVDMHFSYRINDAEYCYDQQLLIDIYPQNEQSDKVLENLTIKISDIKQEGHASDHQLNILKGLDLTRDKTSIFELLEKLKKAELWVPLEMYQGLPLHPAPAERKMSIPPVPAGSCRKLVLEGKNGTNIYLFGKELTAGRSRQADMVLRHEAPPGVRWDYEKMKHMNLKISGTHCKLGIDAKGAWVADMDSTNGTYLDGKEIFNEPNYLERRKEYQLSLASPMAQPYNLTVFLRVYLCPDEYADNKNPGNTAGIVIKRKDYDSEAYLLVNKRLPLASVLPDASNFFVSYRDERFALTDGKNWYWLDPDNPSLPPGCGISGVKNLM
ncbi:MAG: FHA domain-containing protein [Victivallales bacterium]